MKQVKMKQAPVIGHFLPYSSLNGANASGPVANPQMYNVNPRIATTLETPNSSEMGVTADE
jgi:hypothetical protein